MQRITLTTTTITGVRMTILTALVALNLACSDEGTTRTMAAPAAEPERAVAAPTAAGYELLVKTTGNVARYRVREQFADAAFENEAIGTTERVSGSVRLDERAQPVPEASYVAIDVRSLRSDRDRRDAYVRRRILESDTHPEVVFVPRRVEGLTALPANGAATFVLIGDLTIRGVTRPSRWNVSARTAGGVMSGHANTSFGFNAFGLHRPDVPFLASVDDTIQLEYDFVMEIRPVQ